MDRIGMRHGDEEMGKDMGRCVDKAAKGGAAHEGRDDALSVLNHEKN